MNEVPNRANIFSRKVDYSRVHFNDEQGRPKTMDEAYPPSQPAPRTAMEALGIVGEGNMGANVPMSRKGAPKKIRKGRAK